MKMLRTIAHLFSGIALISAGSYATAGNSASNERIRPLATTNSVITGLMTNHGGPVQTAPDVYVVYWGWGADPYGERAYLQNFLSTVGGTPWLNTVNQYSSAGNPTSLLKGTWSDPSTVPTAPTDAQIQNEALSAISHFGIAPSVNIQIIVATPTGHSTPGFGSSFCAYHGSLANGATYTDLPYMTDAGSSCGMNAVSGPLDGVSIVGGHELAESITDPLLNAWYGPGGLDNEIGDKCAWTNLGTIATSDGTYAVQPLWSNAANGCVMSTAVAPPPSNGVGYYLAGCGETTGGNFIGTTFAQAQAKLESLDLTTSPPAGKPTSCAGSLNYYLSTGWGYSEMVWFNK